MLQYLLKISTNVFCHCCPRREGVRRGAVLSSRCLASWPSPSTTVDRKRTSKRRHHVWSVERFALSFSFSFLRSVHGCMGMDVWVNVFTMPLLCADPGPWRRMGRAWPATSAKTTSATTCHQDSAWRGAESRQDRVIVEVVRKAIVVGKCCSMCRTHLTAVHGQQLSYFGCGRKEVRGTAGQRLQLIIPVTPAAWQLLRLSSGTTATIGVHVNGMPLPLAHQLNQLDTCFNKSARNRALKWL